jgi:hypothetical protein
MFISSLFRFSCISSWREGSTFGRTLSRWWTVDMKKTLDKISLENRTWWSTTKRNKRSLLRRRQGKKEICICVAEKKKATQRVSTIANSTLSVEHPPPPQHNKPVEPYKPANWNSTPKPKRKKKILPKVSNGKHNKVYQNILSQRPLTIATSFATITVAIHMLPDHMISLLSPYPI